MATTKKETTAKKASAAKKATAAKKPAAKKVTKKVEEQSPQHIGLVTHDS